MFRMQKHSTIKLVDLLKQQDKKEVHFKGKIAKAVKLPVTLTADTTSQRNIFQEIQIPRLLGIFKTLKCIPMQ